jgi:hypothetical protein
LTTQLVETVELRQLPSCQPFSQILLFLQSSDPVLASKGSGLSDVQQRGLV